MLSCLLNINLYIWGKNELGDKYFKMFITLKLAPKKDNNFIIVK